MKALIIKTYKPKVLHRVEKRSIELYCNRCGGRILRYDMEFACLNCGNQVYLEGVK